MRRVWITGGAGMVGRSLRDHPAAAGWAVLAPPRAELDLTDAAAVARWIDRHRPDAVVHAAGRVGGIAANIAHPVAFLTENLAIGQAVILGAWRAGVRVLINLASTCIYPRDRDGALTEDMILTGPLEPTNEGYALAKIAALRLCDYIRAEDPGAQFKTLIPCNLYGPHEAFDPATAHLVPAALMKVHAAKVAGAGTVEIWGDGTARREFLYAGDLAGAVWRALEAPGSLPGAMNIGTGTDHSVDDYYRIAAEVVGWQGRFVHDPTRPVGMRRKLSDIARATAWGWRAGTPLSEGMARTYAAYRARIAA